MDCFIAFGTALAAKCSEYTVEPVANQFGHLGYLLNYETNLDNLRDQIQQLGFAKEGLKHSVEEAKRNCEEIEPGVDNWLSQADKLSGEAQSFLGDEGRYSKKCFCGVCPNWCSRYKFSKRAVKMACEIGELREGKSKLGKVSHHVSPHVSIENKGFVEFQSRASIMEGITAALRDSNVAVIGVYGVAGVGKTMLAKEVARRDKEEEIFSDVVLAVVSQTPTIENIQQEVAEKLGLELKEKSLSVRAIRLQKRLRQEHNVLIILDDIHEKLELDEVGISFGDEQKGCKILLISRSLDVLCDDMCVEKSFQVGPLSDDESTCLFNKLVGDLAEKPDFKNLVTQIAERCGGLPSAIAKVASELKNKDLFVWKDILIHLERSTEKNI